MIQFPSPRQTIASVALVLTAVALITFSDYLTAQRAALDHAEERADLIAHHVGARLLPAVFGEPPAPPPDPALLEEIAADLRQASSDFGVATIRLLSPTGVIIASADAIGVGRRITPPAGFDRALKGESSSRIARTWDQSATYGASAGHALLETFTPFSSAVGGPPFGICAISQDYRPIGGGILRNAARSTLTHVLLLLVFAALFFRYGRFTGHALEKRDRDLIDALESRVMERTLELEKLRQRVSDLLARREESYRDLMVADEYKQNFIGLVSHELRTPLTVVKGYLGLLKSGVIALPDGESATLALDASLRETRKLETIINNILELGRLDRGLLKVVPETFGIPELVQEAVDLVDSELADRKVEVHVDISPDVAAFTTDRMMLLQVAYQYLGNAVKFSHPGGRVDLAARQGHRGLVLSVRDQGPGIPEPLVGDIFELFHQVDISSTRNHEGSGLGLAIVRRVASVLGGRAWVESEPGRGSTFFFEAPAMAPAAAVQGAADAGIYARRPAVQASGRPVAPILVVDDDEDFRDMVRHLLQTRGYAVEVARDGLEALNRLFRAGSPPPALVLLDVRMPYVNGLDLCRIIRRSLLTREIPVVMVSALASESDVRAGHDSGANAYIVKPFDPDDLTARIAFLLDSPHAASAGNRQIQTET